MTNIAAQIDQLVAQSMPAGSLTSPGGNQNVSTLGAIASPSVDFRVEFDPENPEGGTVIAAGHGTAAVGDASGPAVVSDEGIYQMETALDSMLAEVRRVSALRDEQNFDRDGKASYVRSDRERAVLSLQAEQLARSRVMQTRILEQAKATRAAQQAVQAAEAERAARIEAAAVARAESLEVERRAEQLLKARGVR